MSMAYLQQSCLTNPLKTPTHKFIPKTLTRFFIVSCKYPPNDDHPSQGNSSRKVGKQLAKLAMVTLAAGVLALGSVDDAFAAKSGGRIGGQAFRSSAPRPSAPRSSPRINSRTNIYVNPQVAPPLLGGYGYGVGVPFYGGWGWSPFSFFSPGPAVAVGGGFDLLVLFMFLGAAGAVFRRFLGSSKVDEDDDY